MNEIICIELKRSINKTRLAVLIFFVFSVLFLNQSGINLRKESEGIKEEFIKNEIRKVESYNNYRQYGWSGLKILFVSSPIASMFYPSAFNNLQSSSDTSYRFDIFIPQRGEYLFNTNKGLFFFLIIIGSILILTYGWPTFRNREFIKMLLNTGSKSMFKVYCSIFTGRAILLFISLCILNISLIAQCLLMGVNLKGMELSIIKIMLATFGLMIFLLLLGSGLGNIKNASKGGVIIFVLGMILIFLWPTFFHLKFSENARKDMKSIYRIEAERVKTLHEFEKFVVNYVKDKKDKEISVKKLYENFFNDGKVEKSELDLIDETEKNIKKFHLWSIFNPVIFYESLVNEISGNGFNEKQRFFRESLIKKGKFTKYIIEKMFQQQTGKVEPFLSEDEYIFHAKPSLPHYFIPGVLLTLFYIIVLFIVSYSGFKNYVFGISKKDISKSKDLFMSLEKGKATVYLTSSSIIKDMVYSYFSGCKKGFPGKVVFTGAGIDENNLQADTYYIPHPDNLPANIKVKGLFNFLIRSLNIPDEERIKAYEELNIKESGKKYFADLSYIDKIKILIFPAEVKKAKILLFNEIERDRTEEDYKYLYAKIKELKKDRCVLYLTKNLYVAGKIYDDGMIFIPSSQETLHILQ